MPLYTFKNKDTGEQYNEILTYEELLKYLKKNKDVHQVFKMNIFRYSDNNGEKDQFTEWAKDVSISSENNGGFKTYGKARTDQDKKNDDKEKNKSK